MENKERGQPTESTRAAARAEEWAPTSKKVR